MIAELTISILLIAVVVGFGVFFYLKIKKTNEEYDIIKRIEEENSDIIKTFQDKYINKSTFSNVLSTNNTNIQNIKDGITSKYDSILKQNGDYISGYKDKISTKELTVDGFTFSKEFNNLNIYSSSSNNNMYIDKLGASSLLTNELQIGDYGITHSNNDLYISGTGKVNFNDVTMSNVAANTMFVSGKLNFANINNPTSIEVSPEGDMQFVMHTGSNGTTSSRAFNIVNDKGNVVHKFDIQGNAVHNGDVNINGKCLYFGSNNGDICYDLDKGMTIKGGLCNVVTVSANMNAGSLSTNTLSLGSLSLTSSNNKIVVVDNKTNQPMGNISYMQSI